MNIEIYEYKILFAVIGFILVVGIPYAYYKWNVKGFEKEELVDIDISEKKFKLIGKTMLVAVVIALALSISSTFFKVTADSNEMRQKHERMEFSDTADVKSSEQIKQERLEAKAAKKQEEAEAFKQDMADQQEMSDKFLKSIQ